MAPRRHPPWASPSKNSSFRRTISAGIIPSTYGPPGLSMIGATTGMMAVNRSSAMPAAAVATPRFEPPVANAFRG